MTQPKKSFFEIDHGKCYPETWTLRDAGLFAEFLRTGSLMAAAGLSRLGMKLILSGKLEIKGGDMELLGYCLPDRVGTECISLDDFRYEIDDDITELVPIYRAKSVYAVLLHEDDGHGGSSRLLEVKASLSEAETLVGVFARS